MDIQLWKKQKKTLKLTYDDIAELSGVPKRTVVDIFLQHSVSPRICNVEAIERVLHIAPEQVETYTYGLTDDEKILVDYYRRLSAGSKVIVFTMFKTIFAEAKDIPIETVREYLGVAN